MNRFLFFLLSCAIVACQKSAPSADAYGNFEAQERIVSAEGSGRLLAFTAEEGQTLSVGAVVGAIDSTQLQLRRE